MPFKNNRTKKAWQRRYYREHKRALLDKTKKWTFDNYEKKASMSSAWAKANPERIRAAALRYREKNREEINRKKREKRKMIVVKKTAAEKAAALVSRAIVLSSPDKYGIIGKLNKQGL